MRAVLLGLLLTACTSGGAADAGHPDGGRADAAPADAHGGADAGCALCADETTRCLGACTGCYLNGAGNWVGCVCAMPCP